MVLSSLSETTMSAYQNISTSARAASRPALHSDGLLQRLERLVRDWRKRARYRAELTRLDDRALVDLGFDKATVELEAKRPFWLAPLGTWRELARARRRPF
jgi:uncharacterized protein YjiS (DUF1127 family)